MRNRAWRRTQNLRVQKKRIKRLVDTWGINLSDPDKYNHWFGFARKGNFSCGCKICKPWKHFGNSKKFDKRNKIG